MERRRTLGAKWGRPLGSQSHPSRSTTICRSAHTVFHAPASRGTACTRQRTDPVQSVRGCGGRALGSTAEFRYVVRILFVGTFVASPTASPEPPRGQNLQEYPL